MARRVFSLSFLATLALASKDALFYPEGHFDRVKQVTDYGLFLDFVKDKVDGDKTVFARWIFSTS
jgi:hypothetical protein